MYNVSLKCKWNEKMIAAYLKGFFKIQKNGIFLFGISLFVLEILMFPYYGD